MSTKRTSHQEYINSFSGTQEEQLLKIRSIISSQLGESDEVISYNIPAFKKDGILTFYYSAYTKHISLSFFPTAETYKIFEQELQDYTHSKSAIQFPLNQPLPEQLIRNIITDALPRIITARTKKK